MNELKKHLQTELLKYQFFDIFDLFGDAQSDGNKIMINWEYDSDDEDFEDLEINLVEK